MPHRASIRSSRCPTCGAPLEPKPGQSTMKCQYCHDTVVIHKDLRIQVAATSTPKPNRAASNNSVHLPPLSGMRGPSLGDGRRLASSTGGIITAAIVASIVFVGRFTFDARLISPMKGIQLACIACFESHSASLCY